MKKKTEENNKKLVLEAFDTLFNKRDYAAAERYWSPHYIQHSHGLLSEATRGRLRGTTYTWRISAATRCGITSPFLSFIPTPVS